MILKRSRIKNPWENNNSSVKKTPPKKVTIPIFEKLDFKCNFPNSIKIKNNIILIKPNVNKCKYPIIKKGFNASDFSTKYGNDENICITIFKE